MIWYWKVRIYRPDGSYKTCQMVTSKELCEIDIIQDFYQTLTGCKMLLEGMSEIPFGLANVGDNFLDFLTSGGC